MEPTDFMSRLDKERQTALIALGRRRRYAKNRLIFRAGTDDCSVYVLLEGRAKVLRTKGGRESILWFCGPGEVFGLAEAIRGTTREVSARAAVESEIVVIEASSFVPFAIEHRDVAQIVLEVLAERVRALQETVIDAVASDAATRVIKILCQTAKQYGHPDSGAIRIDILLTHSEIAQMSGASRQTVTTILNDLKRKHLVTAEGRRFWLRDPVALEALAVTGDRR